MHYCDMTADAEAEEHRSHNKAKDMPIEYLTEI